MSTKKPKAPKIQKNQYMQVFVRCRPLNDNESNQRNTSAVDFQGQKDITVQDRCNSKISRTYSFDKVFGPTASQTDVYQSVVEPLISDVLSGFNCTVFAYGQTGSGKTFTMEGDFGTDPIFSRDSRAGVIPRAMCALFDELRVLQAEYTVRISLMELYNEELYDLLSPDEVPPKLRLFDDVSKKGSVIIQGLQEVMVHTQAQVLDELRKGSAKRQVAATLMNAHSSRSHTIFCVTVHSKENSVDGEELLKTGKLNLVDLAGSENIGRSGSVDKRAREAASINQSLLTLSRVTACLVEHQPHVPYRESKLTRLLQDSLGGRTKTSLIATISPANSNIDETVSTLDYAHRAKSVANRPEVNQKVSQNVVMKEYMDVIEDLKKKLDLHRNGSGIYVNDENYRQIVEQNRENVKNINETVTKIRAVVLEMKNAEETFKGLSRSLESHKLNLENVNNTLTKTAEEINVANEIRAKAAGEQQEAQNLLETVTNKENQVLNQAEQLTNVVESSYDDGNKIHNRLDFSRVVLVENQVVLKRLRDQTRFHVAASHKMKASLEAGREILQKLLSTTETLHVERKSRLDTLCEMIGTYLRESTALINQAEALWDTSSQRIKESSLKASSDLSSRHLQLLNAAAAGEKLLTKACADYSRLISSFPNQKSSLIAFVNESIQNMENVTETHMNDMKVKLSSIESEVDTNVQMVVNLLSGLHLAELVPTKKIMDDIKLMNEEANAVNTICLKRREAFASVKTELLTCKNENAELRNNISGHMTATAGYVEQQQEDVSYFCKTVEDAFCSSTQPFRSGLRERAHSMIDTVTQSAAVVERGEKAIELLSCDHKTPIEQALKETLNQRSESIVTLNSGIGAIQGGVHDTVNSLRAKSLSNSEEITEINNTHNHSVDEALGMLLEDVQSTSPEVLGVLENGKSTVKQIVSSEINKDMPTGQTPPRRAYGPIPEYSPLKSPISRKIKQRIEKAPWKRLLRSPRKPLMSTMSLHDVSDDGMVSDSEITVANKKGIHSNGLHKSSSLSDLRSNAVFVRPRIPKKMTRTVK